MKILLTDHADKVNRVRMGFRVLRVSRLACLAGCIVLFAFAFQSHAEFVSIPAYRSVSVASDGAFEGHELTVGFRTFAGGQTHEYRSLLSFRLPEHFESARVRAATFKMYYADAWGSFSPRMIRVHSMPGSWDELAPSFHTSHVPPVAESSVGGTRFGFVSWDATPLVRMWSGNTKSNHGVVLIADPIGLTDNAFRFHSCENVNSGVRPVLEFDYSPAHGWRTGVALVGAFVLLVVGVLHVRWRTGRSRDE